MSIYTFTTAGNTSGDNASWRWENHTYWATTSSVPYIKYGLGLTIPKEMTEGTLKPSNRKENTVNVYLIVLVDAMEGEIIRHQIELGKDESGATAALGLTKEEQKKVTRGDWAIVISKLGSYEAPKITRTKSVG